MSFTKKADTNGENNDRIEAEFSNRTISFCLEQLELQFIDFILSCFLHLFKIKIMIFLILLLILFNLFIMIFLYRNYI